jgi:hypothetical protein
VGTKTEQGKYSGKYALTELLICGDCGTPYRRVKWSKNGQKKIVWRCISRLDYGTKYCKNSPTLEENSLQLAIMKALTDLVCSDSATPEALRQLIGMGLRESGGDVEEYAIQLRLQEIENETSELIALESQDNNQSNYVDKIVALKHEKVALKAQLESFRTLSI